MSSNMIGMSMSQAMMQLVSDRWFVFGMDFFSPKRLSISREGSSRSLPVVILSLYPG